MIKNKNKNISPVILLFIGGIVLTIGDILAVRWVHGGQLYLYALVLILYFIGMVFLIASYKTEDIAVASTILVIFNVIILFVVGVVWFNEIITIKKVVGVLLCFVAVILLELGKKK
jgi:multidrug transporter EmrE-like cation transporter